MVAHADRHLRQRKAHADNDAWFTLAGGSIHVFFDRIIEVKPVNEHHRTWLGFAVLVLIFARQKVIPLSTSPAGSPLAALTSERKWGFSFGYIILGDNPLSF